MDKSIICTATSSPNDNHIPPNVLYTQCISSLVSYVFSFHFSLYPLLSLDTYSLSSPQCPVCWVVVWGARVGRRQRQILWLLQVPLQQTGKISLSVFCCTFLTFLLCWGKKSGLISKTWNLVFLPNPLSVRTKTVSFLKACTSSTHTGTPRHGHTHTGTLRHGHTHWEIPFLS